MKPLIILLLLTTIAASQINNVSITLSNGVKNTGTILSYNDSSLMLKVPKVPFPFPVLFINAESIKADIFAINKPISRAMIDSVASLQPSATAGKNRDSIYTVMIDSVKEAVATIKTHRKDSVSAYENTVVTKKDLMHIAANYKNTGYSSEPANLRQNNSILGAVFIVGGIISGAIIISDANRSETFAIDENSSITIKNQWYPMHTAVITLSITSIIAGLSMFVGGS